MVKSIWLNDHMILDHHLAFNNNLLKVLSYFNQEW